MSKVPRKKQSRKKEQKSQESQLTIINPHTAGIDLGSREHWVCVPPSATELNIRCFGCTTPQLLVLVQLVK